MTLRLALAQINPTVGDLDGNRRIIEDCLGRARRLEADVVIFPEMAITGYPPEDLLLKPDFVKAAMASLEKVLPASRHLTAIVGTPHRDGDLYNAAAVLHDGAVAGMCRKQLLPNYGVFDEQRYFKAGDGLQVFRRGGVTIGVSICEDIWFADGPVKAQACRGGAEVLINISASPYHMDKGTERKRMLAERATENVAFVAYCNMVGGQDEIVFDGQSVVFGPRGELVGRARQFEESLLVLDIEPEQATRLRRQGAGRSSVPAGSEASLRVVELSDVAGAGGKLPLECPSVAEAVARIVEVYQALVLGTRDYVRKNGFEKVVLGLSGGIDSSLVAALAVEALGAANVIGVALPTRFSSSHSFEDAEQVARNLGIGFQTIPIDTTFQSFLDILAPSFIGREPDVTEENIQSRIRGIVLMALSNKFGWLVLTTGNKSEVGVGYSTLYGDSAGGFAIIKDVSKTLVYELVRYVNQRAGEDLVPGRVLEKAPSAELRPDQKDSDALPDYAVLDPILHAYVEGSVGAVDMVGQGLDETAVRRVIQLVDRNEYKRRQSPPGVKITSRAFGKDWRLPITNRYRG